MNVMTVTMGDGGEFRRDRLPDALGYFEREGLKLLGSGIWRKALCPFHEERNPSFSVNVQEGAFKCHACAAKGGDVLDFHMQKYAMNFQDAARDIGAWVDPVADEPGERQERERQHIEAKRHRDEQRQREEEEAAAQSAALFKASGELQADHPYLVRKKIGPTSTLREIHVDQAKSILGYTPKQDGELLRGRLIVAPVKLGDRLSTLEFIDERGRKSAVWRGVKKGGYWATERLPEGDGDGVTILIGEGVATCISAGAATRCAATAALTHGNLAQVAQDLRSRYPKAKLVLLADLGIGLDSARDAATAVDGFLAAPPSGIDGVKDFNDLALANGAEAVKAAIDAAQLAHSDTPNSPGPLASVVAAEWPEPLDDRAFIGLAGDILREVAPETEADQAAVLLQVLVSFGALVGRGPHVRVEGDEHHGNLFALLVGETAKARKGTSWGRVREIFARAADRLNIVNGLSSGEGLIWAVRDPISRPERSKAGSLDLTEIDPGVADKRLLVVEGEFAQVLRQGSRAGNTLSPTLRCAWDGARLSTLTKNNPATATGAHISIIGHITVNVLRAELTATDSANGFATRFLFMCVRRSKLLPFGGRPMPEDRLRAFGARLSAAISRARQHAALQLTQTARQVWAKVYPALSAGHGGLRGSVTARAEAQCIRLALLYALMDEASEIDSRHLLAATAVWERCDASARFIFGTALGDEVADEILRALKGAGAGGLARTAINNVLGRNQSSARVNAALQLLSSKGFAKTLTESRAGPGRRPEIWISC
jgi:phage/plasmid primase-like uncharacterized protein